MGAAMDAHTLVMTAVAAHTSGKLSSGAVAAVVVAGLLVLLCLLWGLARMIAFEPRWTLSLRHSIAEAGMHLSATWAELSDWARLGR